MQEVSMTLRLEIPLKKKLETFASRERRTPENEALCLIENALRVFEEKGKKNYNLIKRRSL
jgi:predicted transcriptional regulator